MPILLVSPDIGADSDLLALIRGNIWTVDSVLRALNAVSAHAMAAAADVGAACEKRLSQQRGVSAGGATSGGGDGVGIGGAVAPEKEAMSLESLEHREDAARKAAQHALLAAASDGN